MPVNKLISTFTKINFEILFSMVMYVRIADVLSFNNKTSKNRCPLNELASNKIIKKIDINTIENVLRTALNTFPAFSYSVDTKSVS